MRRCILLFHSVIGPPGSGKSTVRPLSLYELILVSKSPTQFIHCATKQITTVKHEMGPGTTDIQTFRATHFVGDLPVVLIDTPGSDGGSWTVTQTLSKIEKTRVITLE